MYTATAVSSRTRVRPRHDPGVRPRGLEDFYDTVLATISIEKANSEDWIAEWGVFSISPANEDKPPTRGLHIGFAAPSREHVDEFWRAGVEAGCRDDGEPGLRPEYGDDSYGSFLLAPDGNSAEAVHHDDLPSRSEIDHLWIRVSDVEAAHRFYEALALWTGFTVDDVHSERVKFDGKGDVSFSVVAGTPTENMHMAFPASDNATVEAFHRAALEAGYRDNGGPGERPEYHAGYYGAFVCDPDGNNVEVVNHNR